MKYMWYNFAMAGRKEGAPSHSSDAGGERGLRVLAKIRMGNRAPRLVASPEGLPIINLNTGERFRPQTQTPKAKQ